MTESQEQMEFVKWFRLTYPQYQKSLRVSMNGITFGGSQKWAAIYWNKMKALGLTIGEPDIIILLARGRHIGLVIEHKAEDQKHELTEEQEEHLKYHASQGYLAVETKGLQVLKSIVEDYIDAG